jgi:hypothetical protein
MLNLVLRWWWWWLTRLLLLNKLLHLDKLSTVPEQVARLLLFIFRIDICVQVTGSVQLLGEREFWDP